MIQARIVLCNRSKSSARDLSMHQRISHHILCKHVFMFLLIALLGWLWSYPEAGFVRTSHNFFDYSWGYKFFIHSPDLGIISINKESLAYLNAHMGFLNTPNISINVGSGYEITRMLYALFTKTFWFLEPYLAFFITDIIIWFMVYLSFNWIALNIFKLQYATFISGLLVITGQGFLHSVGEVMTHLPGYALGYFVLFFVYYLKLTTAQINLNNYIFTALFMGIWQLMYGTAFVYLPILYAFYIHILGWKNCFKVEHLKNLSLVSIAALAPGIIISLCGKIFTNYSGFHQLLWSDLLANGYYPLIIRVFKIYVEVLFSLSPFISFPIIGYLFWSYRNNELNKTEKSLRVLGFIYLLQCFMFTLFLLAAPGRGYATFNISAIPVLISIYCYTKIINKLTNGRLKFICLTVFSFSNLLYSNITLLGINHISRYFVTGTNGLKKGYMQNYGIKVTK